MGKLATQVLVFISFFFIFLALNALPSASQEVDDEREFDYKADGENGPARWGEVHPEWHTCSNGSMQSPIDLLNERVQVVTSLGKLNRSYKAANATLKNRGHDMMLQWAEGAGSININGTEYVLQQVHWHSPSEHTINGRRYNLELHMVHESLDKKVAVVGIMYKLGRPDSFLISLRGRLVSVAGTREVETSAGVIDARDLKIGSRKYYRYVGSLTVPPCTENVLWTIVGKVRTVSRLQVKLLRVAVHDESNTNARPLQPLNKRSVKFYRPEESKDD